MGNIPYPSLNEPLRTALILVFQAVVAAWLLPSLYLKCFLTGTLHVLLLIRINKEYLCCLLNVRITTKPQVEILLLKLFQCCLVHILSYRQHWVHFPADTTEICMLCLILNLLFKILIQNAYYEYLVFCLICRINKEIKAIYIEAFMMYLNKGKYIEAHDT